MSPVPRSFNNHISTFGSVYTSALFSILPESLSTLEKMYHPYAYQSASQLYPDEAISAMVSQDDPDYNYWVDNLASAFEGFATSRLNVDDLDSPNPRAYYLRPGNVPYGCHYLQPSPQCHTVWDDTYRAQICESMPSLYAVLKS